MFDNFTPFQGVQKQDFTFRSTRFETWIGGKMVAGGKINSIIYAKVVNINGAEKMEVIFDNAQLNSELSARNIFDEFITSSDRLQLITIPDETNSENMGIAMFKMTVGATRHSKHFNQNEPYCCNLFMKNGVIAKVTFSYSNPEKLLEFYFESEDEKDLELDFLFHSPDHLRYENGKHVAGPHGGASRAIKVERNISGNEGYTVTMYNTDGGQAIVQMAPKQMKIIQRSDNVVVLRGYGQDVMGASFADYGLTIHIAEGQVVKCILHMHDRHVDIEYLAGAKNDTIREPEIVSLAKEANSQYQSEKVTNARQLLTQVYRSVKSDPQQLRNVKDFSALGTSFLMMLDQQLSDDIDALQMMASVSYLCISKAIESNSSNTNLYKDRLLMLRIGHEPFTYTVMQALNIDATFSVMGSMAGLKARDAIYKMEIADLELHPSLYRQVPFFKERKDEFEKMIDRQFFMPEKTLENIIKSGIENHTKIFSYLKNRVIEQGDVDF